VYNFYYYKCQKKSFIDFIEDVSIKLIKTEIFEYKNMNNEINKQIDNLEKKLNEIENNFKNFMNEQKKSINKLKIIYNRISYNDIKKMKELLEEYKFNQKKLDELKLNCEKFLKSEKIISVIFISLDENLHYSVICNNKDKFSKVESLLYDKYPNYKNINNIFTNNGNEINKSKNLDENNIKNNDIIILKTK